MKNVTFLFLTGFLFINFQLIAQTIEWEKNYGGSGVDQATFVQQTSDDGFIIAGYSDSDDGDVASNNGGDDIWVVKVDLNGVLEWEKNLGGSQTDWVYSIQQTTDGGYIVGGSTSSNDADVSGNQGQWDIWIVKLDQSGNIVWENTFGGSRTESALAIQQTLDGGYVVGANTSSNDGDVGGNNGLTDFWTVKLDPMGAIEWERNYGGSGLEWARSIQQTSDKGYIISGNANSTDGDVSVNKGKTDIWVIKIDSLGVLEWEKSLGGSGSENALAIRQTNDGGYIAAGNTDSNDGDVSANKGGVDYWVVKLDNMGGIEWEKTLGGSSSDDANSIQQTLDGGYIVGGNTSSTDGDVSGFNGIADYWAVKIDPNGVIEWEKNLGGSGNDRSRFIQQTKDEGFVMAGYAFSNDGDVGGNKGSSDFWVVKFAPMPNVIEEPGPSRLFTIYPNPSDGNFSISLHGVSGNVQVRMFDLLGKEIFLDVSDLSQLNIQGIPSGVYMIQVIDDKVSETRRMVIH